MRGGNLPSEYAIVGFARRDWTDADLRSAYEQTLSKSGGADFQEVWQQFANRIVFSPGTFDDPASYQTLKATLDRVDQTLGTQGNRIFYLAVAPEFFATIIKGLGEAGLIYPGHQDRPWSRVVIEKPFGHDLQSARALNRDVSAVLDESQVYRIDHYLGKETVQNIHALRFGNTIFEPVWNRRYVASVQITVAEEVGMAGGRGAYYDTAGTIRDMVQNHMMQLLSLVAMEPPVDLSADAVRNEKVKVLQALPRWRPEDVFKNVVRAQYTAGSIQGTEAPGYLQEKGVAPDSKTDTYVAIRLELSNWRWAGVPFFLRTGKRLPKRATEIAIQFHRPPTELFEAELAGQSGANQLVLRIQPNEGASLTFEAKVPGSRRRFKKYAWISAMGRRSLSLRRRPTSACSWTRCWETPRFTPALTRSRAPGGLSHRFSMPGKRRRLRPRSITSPAVGDLRRPTRLLPVMGLDGEDSRVAVFRGKAH